MRWNAISLFTSLIVMVLVGGCGLFGKKKDEPQTAEAVGDPYVAPVYEEPAQRFDPYPEEPEPAHVERSYPTMTGVVETPAGPRYHVVAKKETLYQLARIYYDDASRWKDIYEANRGEIEDPDKIFIGQRLLIP